MTGIIHFPRLSVCEDFWAVMGSAYRTTDRPQTEPETQVRPESEHEGTEHATSDHAEPDS